MKRIALIFSLFIFCGMSYANDVIKLQATAYSYKTTNNYGNWTDWSDWTECNILVVIKNDRVNIYSNTPQEYDIYDSQDAISDGEGGTVMTFKCVDKEGERCDIRIRILASESVQLYVDYSNFMFVYNVQFK